MIDTSARLITVSYVGELGRAQTIETATPIFCSLDTVNRTEYYAAFNSGFKPEFRLTTDPINYSGEGIVEVDTPEGTVRCDIYRTYRKAQDELELWCVKKNPEAVQTFTLWNAGRCVTLFGCYLTGTDGADRTETGRVATDTVRLILPQTFQAFIGETPVAYCRPKAWAAMNEEAQANHFYIDTKDFFALGRLETIHGPYIPDGADSLTTANDRILWCGGVDASAEKYQHINSLYDDVYLVQSVNRINGGNGRERGKPDTEYLEVIGK